MTAAQARAHLRKLADPKSAAVLSKFFKTGKGEYAEGDQFLGIRAAQMGKAARNCRELADSQLDILLRSCIHEHRLLALMVLQLHYRDADPKRRAAIHRFYLKHTKYVNNWDLVDDSAPTLVGEHLLDGNLSAIYKLAKSKRWWERRIAVVSTLHFIRNNRFVPTLDLALDLLEDEHDLVRKAIGWMLREIGKRDERILRKFVHRFAARMPRVTLRYAIERLPVADRGKYMKIPSLLNPLGGA
jgi:3-methyladenine DNA glycosylase AlkD